MDELLITLRVLINDVVGTTYSDIDLKRLIVVSTNFVSKEVDFANTYTTNVELGTITPDPTDTEFINLVSRKAAIILLESELRQYGKESITISDGPSSINTAGIYKNTESLLKQLYEQYDKMKMEHGLHGSQNTRHAISTPTTVEYNYGRWIQ